MSDLVLRYEHLNDNDKAPDILYKYFSGVLPSGKIPYIETDHQLRYSQPGAFNDIYECRPDLRDTDFKEMSKIDRPTRIELMKRARFYLQKLGKKSTYDECRKFLARVNAEESQDLRKDPLLKERDLNQYFTQSMNTTFLVLSLTEEWDNSAMWGYYANSNAGFVLGFDAKHEALQESVLLRVDYQTERIKVKADVIKNQSPGHDESIVKLIKTKSLNWDHECEWRSLMSAEALAPIAEGVDSRGFSILGKEIPIDCLKEIIFGAEMLQDDIDRISGQLPGHVSRFKAKPHLRHYNLDRDPL